MYGLMTGRGNPVVDGETLWMFEGVEGWRIEEGKRADEKAVVEGRLERFERFEKWSILTDEE